jgi:hypothetical protein
LNLQKHDLIEQILQKGIEAAGRGEMEVAHGMARAADFEIRRWVAESLDAIADHLEGINSALGAIEGRYDSRGR